MVTRWIDLAGVVTGFGLLVGGLAMVSRPGAMMLAGVLLLAGSVWRAK